VQVRDKKKGMNIKGSLGVVMTLERLTVDLYEAVARVCFQ
jgi:hypothetical protein